MLKQGKAVVFDYTVIWTDARGRYDSYRQHPEELPVFPLKSSTYSEQDEEIEKIKVEYEAHIKKCYYETYDRHNPMVSFHKHWVTQTFQIVE